MVFTTSIRLFRSPNPDCYWRRRRVLKMSAHLYGRARNCYSIAVRAVKRALQYQRLGRKQKKIDMIQLWHARISAGTEEHGLNYTLFREGLTRCNIMLDRKSLADLAIWEPRTFKALTQIATTKVIDDKLPGAPREQPKYFFQKDYLKKFWNY